ncbi:hypothetical protein PYW08_015199 [Mythimna loreyi]|uniref:Uncharacterized protein n=1 Tax=Mythimna loreyi TaxID=667449 RepID=A0ACC2QVA2_9NEOP|nr:hypothetical protein PYW08_015199 [Mythimna loreyi]
MRFIQMYICVLKLIQVIFNHVLAENLTVGMTKISNETLTAYNVGIAMGIINPEKYSLKSFEKDEPRFRKLYKVFTSINEYEPITYQQFLVLNNYGLFPDTQESVFQNKTSTRSRSSKKSFKRIVEPGDILISGRSDSGLVGHAAIMITNYWVLEMAGGSKYKKGIKSNNRLISKGDWYDDNYDDDIIIYRCPDTEVAENAAHWADTNYYNPDGGQEKTIHVTYKIEPNSFKCKNPSYSSKLVVQAYYHAEVGVIAAVEKYGSVIVPIMIPAYFMPPYDLDVVAQF